MIDVSKWALKNYNLIRFFVFVLVVGGIWACWQMGKLEDPEVKVKQAMVITKYPGASAHQVELEVTDALEKSIRSMGNVDHIESYSYNDLSLIQVELLSTVSNEEIEQCWDILRRKVGQTVLPKEAESPIVKDDFGDVYGMFYALTGKGYANAQLSDYAELVQREVGKMEGIDRVELYGKRNECIQINLLQDRMATLGVTPTEVLATLNGQNKTSYSGYYQNGNNRIRVTVADGVETMDDIANIFIQGHDNGLFRLSDIARIEKAVETPVRNELFYDGEPAIGILIAASTDADIVKLGAEVDRQLRLLQTTRFPVGVEFHKVFNQPERVKDSLVTFVLNLIESVLIVILILMLTMGIKSGLMIGSGLLVTVLGSFLFLYYLNGTLQRISLGALILAMGMLVDNAIVIMDGILVDLKAGKTRLEAMTAIGRQTAMPLLGATWIAILAFLPIFLSPDTAGIYTRDLFIVLAVSLMLSWILALVHIPLMANRYLFPKKNSSEGERLYEGRIYESLRSILRFGLSHRWSCVLSMLILFLLSLIGSFFMKRGFFPDMEYDQLYVEYKLPEGYNSTQVAEDLQEIESYLKTRNEIVHVTTSVGGTPGRYNLVRSIANPSLTYGELIVDFTSSDALVENMDEIQDYLARNYPNAYVKVKRYNLMFKKYPIEAQFLGPDPVVLHQLTDTARFIMENIPEVCFITTDWMPDVPVLIVNYDQPAARLLGLSRNDVSLSLLTATEGVPISTLYQGKNEYRIYLKCLDEKGEAIERLNQTQVFPTVPSPWHLMERDFFLKLESGSMDKEEVLEAFLGTTPLQQVSENIDVGWETSVVPRYDGQRSQRVQCSPALGVETEDAWKIVSERIESIPLPEGYSLQWQGEKSASEKSMKHLFSNFPLAIILIISILIMLFKDYRKPIIICCCLPLTIVGIVIIMLLTGKVFNFVAIVGTLGLMGMLIKNGIVLMDEINLQISEGVEPIKALINSSQSRFRPVMMASLTTVLGMIPLLSDAMFGSMAAAIMGGLLFSTVITLFFIPVLYALFFKIKLQ